MPATADANQAVIRDHFRGQAGACRRLGSPFTARICVLLAERLNSDSALGRRVLEWQGDPRDDALALRCAGALNALARSGRAPSLAAAYPPSAVEDDALWAAVEHAIASHDDELAGYLDSPPQTNEVRRCSALLGGALIVAAETGCSIALLEIGASAGLNTNFDRYRYEFGTGTWRPEDAGVLIRSEWRGSPPNLQTGLSIGSRQACDLNPLDPGDEQDRSRMLSYIWPDQAERLATTQAALDLAAKRGWDVERADAAPWVEARLADLQPAGQARMLIHTIMWQYLPAVTRARISAAMEAAGERATAERPIAWLRMEADDQPHSAGVLLTIWPGGTEREIARADFHGRWVEWTER